MKKMNFEQMEVINGGQTVSTADGDAISADDYRIPGWKFTVEQHIGCALGGLIVGFGWMGAAAYAACLLVLVDDYAMPVVN